MTPEKLTLPAISGVDAPAKVRVVIFINGQLVHVPLPALLSELMADVQDLRQRVTDLETP